MPTLTFFETIEKIDPIQSASGDLIPAPPHAPRQGNFFYVNCVFPKNILSSKFEDALDIIRKSVISILKEVPNHIPDDQFLSVVVSVFFSHEVDKCQRFYRYSLTRDALTKLFCDPLGVNPESLDRIEHREDKNILEIYYNDKM